MYRYLVLIWDGRDPEAVSDAGHLSARLPRELPSWSRVVDETGLAAFHADAGGLGATSRDKLTSCESRVLSGRRRGVVFGRLFRRGSELQSHPADEPIDATESERMCDSGGEHLIENYWGRYVAILREGANQKVRVVRDPSGGLPCYIARYKRLSLVFSDIEPCLGLGLMPFSINWRFIASMLPYSALQIRETGLNEVQELQPGERASFSGNDVEYSLLWRPAELADRARIVDPEQATAVVRETVKETVHAWASLHRSVTHNLSGGLDSSIVLGCLRSAPNEPRVTCIHYFAPAGNEDERHYARLSAKHMDVELVECELDGADAPLEKLMDIRLAPKPWFYIYDLVHSPLEVRVMSDRGATGAFSGAGGDGLFMQARADLAVVDYLRHFGYRPGLFGVAHDAARINRASIWSILYEGMLRHGKKPTRNLLSEFGGRRAVIPPEIYEKARTNRDLLPPWIRAAEGLTPGLMWQIVCLSIPPHFYEAFGGATAIERTPVLMSQPVMEACLRIPTYVWITGGRDRSIARRAFTDVLPRAIIRRTQKGLADRYNRRMLDKNAAFLREMLLDGLLVKAGLLDRAKLEEFTSVDSASESFEYNQVLRHHLCTEIWVRRWSAATTSSAR
ncbi:MAG: asparagine synthase-related protein [Gammaproteobacteria bacterium]